MLERELTHHIINSAPLPAQHKTSFIMTLSLSSSVLLKRSLKLLSARLAQPVAVLWLLAPLWGDGASLPCAGGLFPSSRTRQG